MDLPGSEGLQHNWHSQQDSLQNTMEQALWEWGGGGLEWLGT